MAEQRINFQETQLPADVPSINQAARSGTTSKSESNEIFVKRFATMQDSRISCLAQIDFSAFVKGVQRINIGHYKY